MELLIEKVIHPADVDPATNQLDLPLATVQRLFTGLTPAQACRLHGWGVAVTMADWFTGAQYCDVLLRCLGPSGPFMLTSDGCWDVVQHGAIRAGDVLKMLWRRETCVAAGEGEPLVLVMAVEKMGAEKYRWKHERWAEAAAAAVDQVAAGLVGLPMPPV